MAVVLVLAAVFVYLRVSSDLGSSIDDGLTTRADDLERLIESGDSAAIDLGDAGGEGGEDILSEVLRTDGSVVGSSRGPANATVLDPGRLAEARGGGILFDAGEVPGIEENARLLARPVQADDGSFIVVTGASTGDRAETLSGLVKTFAIGGPLALLLASAIGYGLASLAMRPVEAMRARAGAISLDRRGERLPLPATADEIGRLGKTLNEMLTRIEASLERERSFIADASHELRTPLAVIRGELELGLRPGRDEAERKAAMVSAAEEVDRLQALADDLLALARSDDGRLPLDLRTVSIAELLERVRGRSAVRADAAGRPLVITAEEALEANLDPVRIESALINLVDNALRHGDGPISLEGSRSAEVLTLRVSDRGPGFPADFIPVAFERFSRAEAGRTTTGSGLGLSIVRAIATAHGGRVEIDQDGVEGAGVVIEIPDRPSSSSSSGGV